MKLFLLISLLISSLTFAKTKELNLDAKRVKKVAYMLASTKGISRSAFGHSYLRFSYEDKFTRNDITVEFVADETASKLSYLRAMGLSFEENYPIKLSLNKFRDTLKIITIQEDRDLTTYELNLTPKQISNLTNQVVLMNSNGVNKNYSFFNQNCATIITSLLKDNSDIIYTNLEKNVPIFVVRALEKNKLIKNISTHNRVSTQRKKLVKKLSKTLDLKRFLGLKELLTSKNVNKRVQGYYRLQSYRHYSKNETDLDEISSIARRLLLIDINIVKKYMFKYFTTIKNSFDLYEPKFVRIESYIDKVSKTYLGVDGKGVYLKADLGIKTSKIQETSKRFYKKKVYLKELSHRDGVIYNVRQEVIARKIPGEFYGKNTYVSSVIIDIDGNKMLSFILVHESKDNKNKILTDNDLLAIDNGFNDKGFCLTHSKMTKDLNIKVIFAPNEKRISRKDLETLVSRVFLDNMIVIPGFKSIKELTEYLGDDFLFEFLYKNHQKSNTFGNLALDWFKEKAIDESVMIELRNLTKIGINPIISFLPHGQKIGHSLMITDVIRSKRGYKISAVDPNSHHKGQGHTIIKDIFWFNPKTNKIHTLYYGNVKARLRPINLITEKRIMIIKENENLKDQIIKSAILKNRYYFSYYEVLK